MALVCDNCGARSPETTARFCSYCGHEFPRPAAAEAPPTMSALLSDVRKHPEFERLMQHEPTLGARRGQLRAGLVGAAVFVGIGAFAVMPMLLFPPLAIAGVAVVALGVLQLIASATKMKSLDKGELVRVPARVIDERIHVSGNEGSRVQTRYYVSLESEQGSREEYEVDAALGASVARDDVGVAYFKGPYLVEFRRLSF